MEWFRSLTGFGQVLCIIGLCTAAILVIQVIMLIIGLESGDHDFDASPDVSGIDEINDDGFLDFFGLRLLTLRGIIAFLAVGSWSALAMLEATDIVWLAVIVGVVAGSIAMLLVAYVMKKINNFQESGNVEINNSIGKNGIVYLKIPANKKGLGKVNLVVQERYVEFDAVTEDDSDIKTGSEIIVLDVSNNVLVVTRKQ